MKFGRQLIRNFRHASRAPATTATSVVLRGGTDRDSRGCEKCGSQRKKTQVSESGFHVVVLLGIRNPTLSLAVGWEASLRFKMLPVGSTSAHSRPGIRLDAA
jgi:hypothetical protein